MTFCTILEKNTSQQYQNGQILWNIEEWLNTKNYQNKSIELAFNK